MNERPTQPAAGGDLTEEAAFWCMRLHAPDCTPEERAAFDRWLAQSAAHDREYREMLEIWTISTYLPRRENRPAPVLARPTGGTRLRRFGAIAAGVVLCGWLGWNLGWLPSGYQRVDSGAELRSVALADGSRVQLNRDSALSFWNFKDRRYVRLGRGEVFFHVQHDSAHPFEVRAGSGLITVTGTRFNVWRYRDQVVVTLTEGSVEITNDSEQPGPTRIRLAPGQQARFDAGAAQPQVATVNPENVLAWLDGKLVLDNLPLSAALPLINRYLAQPVLLGDEASGRLRIGGVFKTDDMRTLVQNLPKVLPVQLTQNAAGNTVINRQRALR